MITIFKTLAFIFQPIIIQVGFKTFDCVSLPEFDDNKTYMRVDHSIECGSTQFFLLSFGFALPILFIWGNFLLINLIF